LKGSKTKGPGDEFELNEEHSSVNVTEATHQPKNFINSHSEQPCYSNKLSSESKSIAGHKRYLLIMISLLWNFQV
jgi:hypothetical protein